MIHLKTLLASSLILLFVGNSFSAEYLSNQTKQEKITSLRKLLGPYPAKGSPEEAFDFATLTQFQETRTTADCDRAKIEEKASLKTFFVEVGGLLSAKEVKRMKIVLAVPFADFLIFAGITKEMYKRPRPYVTDTNLKPCVRLSNTWAYPSGHTAMARMYARILGKFYPGRAEQFLKRGDEVALDRVISGLHHPSDIVAGKKLGDALADHYIDSDDFKKQVESFK